MLPKLRPGGVRNSAPAAVPRMRASSAGSARSPSSGWSARPCTRRTRRSGSRTCTALPRSMSDCSTAISPGQAEAMLTLDEMAHALGGVYRIAVFDRAGRRQFRQGSACLRASFLLGLCHCRAGNAAADRHLRRRVPAQGCVSAGCERDRRRHRPGGRLPLLLLPLLRRVGRSERWPGLSPAIIG